MKRVLVVYQFATLGGVERALLNRAVALKTMGSDIRMDLLFLRDYGGLAPLRAAIDAFDLDNQIRIVTQPQIRDYNYFSVIDTPEIFEFIPRDRRILVECHASSYESQRYLFDLPPNVHSVAVPSLAMQQRLGPRLGAPVKLIPNRIPSIAKDDSKPTWNRPLLFYIGRIEPGKNVAEALRLHAEARRFIPDLGLLILTPTVDWSHVRHASEKLGTRENIFIHGALPFHKLQQFYSRLNRTQSYFVSSSRHETWGLSAAEALVAGIPAILSDNEGHREVVQGDQGFLYRLGFPHEGVNALKRLAGQPAETGARLARLQEFHTKLSDVATAFEELL